MFGKKIHTKARLKLLVFALIAVSCRHDASVQERPLIKTTALIHQVPVRFDLDAIRERGSLIALTLNSSTSYFVYRGQAMGYDYELLKRFTESIGVELEIKIIPDVNAMFDLLNKGKGDVIACNLAITQDRRKLADFSVPYNFTRQVLVQRKPEGWQHKSRKEQAEEMITSPIGLIGKKVFVNKSSTFFSRLESLQNEIGGDIEIVKVPGYIGTEKLIKKVSEGSIDYTVADDNVAKLNATYYKNLDISVQLSFPQRVAWATRKNSPKLLSAINAWFKKDRKTMVYAYIYDKYFEASKEQWKKFNGEYSSLNGNKICDYDKILKKYAKDINWDWRLLAAQMYQESRFNEDARSWVGAFGLMQFMPATAKMYGIDSTSSPEEQIRAAILYLSWINDYWKERVFDSKERINFVLASYNVGLGHVIDASNLALSLGYNPLKWEGNVAECILLKANSEYYTMDVVKYGYCRGSEPYGYVKNIIAQYHHYKRVIS